MPAPKGQIPWNKGTSKGWVDKRGYRWIYVTEYGKRRAKREHRVIMEKHLDRKLEPWEVIHHKDGDTLNNNVDNLEVIDWGEHTKMHHENSKRPDLSKKSMEAHAQMREEIKRLRIYVDELDSQKSELLEALKKLLEEPRNREYWLDAENVIAKAEGDK